LLANARDAFAARVLLARAAECTLDIQHYIVRDLIGGKLPFEWAVTHLGYGQVVLDGRARGEADTP
jgi:hypothetical protein